MSATHVHTPFAASAISGHLDTRTAATEIADRLFDEFLPHASACDLALIFGSYHHRSAFDDAAAVVRKTLNPGAMIGVTAEAVLGNDRELEGVAGMSVMAMRLPGATVTAWRTTPDDPMPLGDPAAIRARIGFDQPFRAAIMFGDPFTTPVTKLVPAISECASPHRVPIVGGMASGASQPGLNAMVINDRTMNAGAVGVSIAGGHLDFDFIVSQGCRPIGQPHIVTKCNRNVILELGGRKAMEVLQETAHSLSDAEKRLLSRGLLMGTVINEYKDRFGRGDFLVKNLMGFDQRVGGIAAGELCKVGQTIQFHVRDAATADEDLQLLLDGQALNPNPPFAAMLFGCNGRGEKLFGHPHHDISVVRERLGEVPVAGFFAAGEFGPIGDRSFLHGHTASLMVLRGKA